MTLIINPGSGPAGHTGAGWQNTEDGAWAEARRWLRLIEDSGIRDVILVGRCEDLGDGRWRFWFRHEVTGVEVELDTHGVDDVKAWRAERPFAFGGPRVYWNGSSSSEPEIEQWAAAGFEVVKTFRPAPPP